MFLFQHALRLHAFRQVHTVLDVEPLKPSARGRGQGRGKRRRDDSREKNAASAKILKKDEVEEAAAEVQE